MRNILAAAAFVVMTSCALQAEVPYVSRASVAEFRIGYSYERGQGQQQDYAEAMRHYLIAASEGNPQAEFRIGYLYERGLGVPVDLVQARQWYTKAAQHGHEAAGKKLSNGPI
jgi:FOG: TPR repeat, SEL1 subfamily